MLKIPTIHQALVVPTPSEIKAQALL